MNKLILRRITLDPYKILGVIPTDSDQKIQDSLNQKLKENYFYIGEQETMTPDQKEKISLLFQAFG